MKYTYVKNLLGFTGNLPSKFFFDCYKFAIRCYTDVMNRKIHVLNSTFVNVHVARYNVVLSLNISKDKYSYLKV